MDEASLTERLIAYDTSQPDELAAAFGFAKGWLEARDIDVRALDHHGLPVLVADVGPRDAPAVVLHGHLDVVPAFAGQFEPRVDGDRLIGRGAYDMKGGLAVLMHAIADAREQERLNVRLVIVPDEESDDVDDRSIDALVAGGLRADFAITGEPTDLHIGVQAKGVLAVRACLSGTAAHGSTPWLGDNAILKAYDAFRRIETLPFSRESSDLFDRPSINLSRIVGGDAFNKVPDRCSMDVDIRFLPTQDPARILQQIRDIPDLEVTKTFTRAPAVVSRRNPFVLALREAARGATDGEALSVGRDGASDAIAFLQAGVPAVEFGPVGGGHHGPEEWVSIASLRRYREALREFVRVLPEHLDGGGPVASGLEDDDGAPVPRALDDVELRTVEGGLA